MSKANDTPRWMKAEARRLQSAHPGLAYADALRRVRDREGLDAQLPGAPVGVTQSLRDEVAEVLVLARTPGVSAETRTHVEDAAEALLNERDPMRRWQAMRRAVSLTDTVKDAHGLRRALVYEEALMRNCAEDVLRAMDHPVLGPWASRQTESNPLRAVISGECDPLECMREGEHNSWFDWATCETCGPQVPVWLLDPDVIPVGYASFPQQDDAIDDPDTEVEALAWLAAEAKEEWLPALLGNPSMPAEVLAWVASRGQVTAETQYSLAWAKHAPLWLVTWILDEGNPVVRSGPDDRPETLHEDFHRLTQPLEGAPPDSVRGELFELDEVLAYRRDEIPRSRGEVFGMRRKAR